MLRERGVQPRERELQRGLPGERPLRRQDRLVPGAQPAGARRADPAQRPGERDGRERDQAFDGLGRESGALDLGEHDRPQEEYHRARRRGPAGRAPDERRRDDQRQVPVTKRRGRVAALEREECRERPECQRERADEEWARPLRHGGLSRRYAVKKTSAARAPGRTLPDHRKSQQFAAATSDT